MSYITALQCQTAFNGNDLRCSRFVDLESFSISDRLYLRPACETTSVNSPHCSELKVQAESFLVLYLIITCLRIPNGFYVFPIL